MWFIFVFIATAFYALAEVFLKKSSDLSEKYSELKVLICFGFFNGIISFCILLLGLKETTITAIQMISEKEMVLLSPLLYYVSLLFCFLAFELAPVSILAPITSMDGIFTFMGVIILYFFINKVEFLYENINSIKFLLALIVSIGVYFCALSESKREDREANKKLAKNNIILKSGRFVFIGVAFALLSAMLDAGSALTDIYILGEMSESYDYIYVHGLIVFGFSIVLYIVLWILEKKPYNFFEKNERYKMIGAGFDSLATVFNMMAIAINQFYTNVLVSSFCVFTVLLSRVILKEKINKKQYFWIGLTIACIIMFTIVDEI